MIKGKNDDRVAGPSAKNKQLTPDSSSNGGYGENNSKLDDLASNTEDSAGEFLTTNQGVRVNDNQNSLKAGDRGPTLLEDFILREKITHFDHERIPERVVHARGSGAHGYFQVYESMAQYTKADFLQDPSVKTPVFVRFSTVAGSRGSGAARLRTSTSGGRAFAPRPAGAPLRLDQRGGRSLLVQGGCHHLSRS
jgi:catalase